MSRGIVAAIIVFVALSVGASQSARETAVDLDQYRWKSRLLLLFAPTRDHPWFDSLHRSLMTRKADVADRDLVFFEVLESGLSTLDTEPLDPGTAEMLREKFGVAEGSFSVVLVGKDGGVKLDHQGQIRVEEIFALIDAMPMRQEEMRR
jgi:hypothetical protein